MTGRSFRDTNQNQLYVIGKVAVTAELTFVMQTDNFPRKYRRFSETKPISLGF